MRAVQGNKVNKLYFYNVVIFVIASQDLYIWLVVVLVGVKF